MFIEVAGHRSIRFHFGSQFYTVHRCELNK